jgi:hypothetical protein
MNNKKLNRRKIKQKIAQALSIIIDLGFPREQQNERSALTLLALLELKPDTEWKDAGSPLMGITSMMEFFEKFYGKHYAPNTRETVRRQTIHQFEQAALISHNPDKPLRPTNSPKAVYQIEPTILKLLHAFGTPIWETSVQEYLNSKKSLSKRYASEREMTRIPIHLPSGQKIKLSPGGQNILVKKIIDDFCSFFTPGSHAIYVGDTQKKWAYFDKEALIELGVSVDDHGKMPDVVVHYIDKNWLILIEAVTSHGPVNPKRRRELKKYSLNHTQG